MILYGVTLIELKTKESFNTVKRHIRDFEARYPQWYRNPYLKELDMKKRVFLWAVRYKAIVLCSLYADLHSFLLARRAYQ